MSLEADWRVVVARRRCVDCGPHMVIIIVLTLKQGQAVSDDCQFVTCRSAGATWVCDCELYAVRMFLTYGTGTGSVLSSLVFYSFPLSFSVSI